MAINKILVIDDSPTQVCFLSNILKQHNYTVFTATDGANGIRLAELEQPDLILMDVAMPGVSGFQATRKLSRNDATKAIPVIMCTSKGETTDKIWGLRQGAVDYLVKPVDEALLITKIKALG